VQRKIGLGDFDEAARQFVFRHQAFSFETFAAFFSLTGDSQSLCLATRPATTSKNSFLYLGRHGSTRARAMTRPSSSRIGVTSAAVR